MKTLLAPMSAHLTRRTLTLANMWKLTRIDGTIMGFTDHDQDLIFNDGTGALLYEANSAVTASALSSSGQLRVDTQDAAGMITSDRVTDEDLRGGRYDNAEIRYFKVNYRDLSGSMGDIKMKLTHTGEVRLENGRWITELRSLSQAYSQGIIDLIQPACGVDLGSAKCKVVLDPPLWQPANSYTVRELRDAGTGSIVKPAVANGRWFKAATAGVSHSDEPIWDTTLGAITGDLDTDGEGLTWEAIQPLQENNLEVIEVVNECDFWVNYTGDAPNDLYTLGTVIAENGFNEDIIKEIKDFDQASDGPARIKTFLPWPFPLQGAVSSTGPDTVTIKAGCEKDRAFCIRNFDNIENYHGFPDLPGNDRFFFIPTPPAAG